MILPKRKINKESLLHFKLHILADFITALHFSVREAASRWIGSSPKAAQSSSEFSVPLHFTEHEASLFIRWTKAQICSLTSRFEILHSSLKQVQILGRLTHPLIFWSKEIEHHPACWDFFKYIFYFRPDPKSWGISCFEWLLQHYFYKFTLPPNPQLRCSNMKVFASDPPSCSLTPRQEDEEDASGQIHRHWNTRTLRGCDKQQE